MTEHKPATKRKPSKTPLATLSYSFKPRTIRNTPLDRYDAVELQSASNHEITDHFNYGFNSETFPIYAKLCRRFAEAEDLEHPNAPYDPMANQQFMFNDDTPIDLGGFGPFLDKELIDIWENDSFQNGDSLMDFFIRFNICLLTKKGSQTPNSLIEFVRLMAESQQFENKLAKIIDELADRINDKYKKTLNILKKKEEHPQGWKQKLDEQNSTLTEEAKQNNFFDDLLGYKIKPIKEEPEVQEKSINKQIPSMTAIDTNKKEQSQESLVYSSIEGSDEEGNDGAKQQSKSNGKVEEDSHSESQSQSSHKSSHHSHQRESFKQDKRLPQKKQKKQKSQKRQRQQRHKKKKQKSKRIKKQKSHKKHKKHGKRSKKHKR